MESEKSRKQTYFWSISDSIKVSSFRDRWLNAFSEFKTKFPAVSATRDTAEGAEGENASSEEANDDSQNQSFFSPQQFLNFIPKDLSTDAIADLDEVCSVDKLTCVSEPSEYVFADLRLMKPGLSLPFIPSGQDLITLKLQHTDLKKRWADEKYRKLIAQKRLHLNAERLLLPKSLNENSEKIPVDPNEVVLSVIVCRPSKSYAKYNLRRGGSKFLVLGSQTLTEFRDVIHCSVDYQPTGDFRETHQLTTEEFEIAKDVYRSGFFFINGRFYNDMRHSNNVDYSETIREWIDQNPDMQAKFGSCSTKSMEETTFNDLKIKLGYAYLYKHQGDCEHYILFNDLRLINDASDPMDRSHYPYCYSTKINKGTRCMMCCVFPPKWITRQHERVHADPFLFCEHCYYSFNFDCFGQKIGNFQTHPYVNL